MRTGQTTEIKSAVYADKQLIHIGPIHTVQTLAMSEPALNEGGIRWTIHRYKDKLIEKGAIFYCGRKLIIDRDRYIACAKEGLFQ